MTVQHTAFLATAVLGGVICLQLLLASGLPLGRMAWGGQHTVLPARLRFGSLAAAFILGGAAWVMLARVGLVRPGGESVAVQVAAWVMAGFFGLNTLGNLASKSPSERLIMSPATLVLVVCFVLVARS